MMRIFLLISAIIVFSKIKAQYPNYFNYSGAQSLPSDEVYCILQDNYGLIWIGCDAGLYKFDGIRYHLYKSKNQTSKSVTGLTISKSGKIYCYNFNSQVFVLKNDSLSEIYSKSSLIITNITTDSTGKLYVSHSAGIDVFDENTNLWKSYSNSNSQQSFSNNNYVCKLSKNNPPTGAYFLSTKGVGYIKNNTYSVTPFKNFQNYSPGNFLLEYHKNEIWIFKAEDKLVYNFGNNQLKEIKSEKLLSLIENRKITNLKSLPDGKLWICTYKGIISFDTQKDSLELFYPDKAFSDCLIDREGNYWMTTLQDGILRIPNMQMRVWNSENKLFTDDKISKVLENNGIVYFASNKGTVGELNINTNEINFFPTNISGDVQSFDYDNNSNILSFNINNKFFQLKANKLTKIEPKIKAIKTYLESKGNVFIGSSHGFFINDSAYSRNWVREMYIQNTHDQVWVATNKGLFSYSKIGDKWSPTYAYFKGIQIASINFDTIRKEVIVLTFKGSIYSIDSKQKLRYISKLPVEVVPYKLKLKSGIAYFVATNKGLWIYSLSEMKWLNLNRLSGIAADNVQDLCVINDKIMLATSNGLQVIPLLNTVKVKKAKVHVKKVMVNGSSVSNLSNIVISYNKPLLIFPEASIYSSNGNFTYAYRLKNTDTTWFTLPSDIQKIQIPNIPSGNFIIELKVIDNNGYSSENTIVLSGYSIPPYWRTWWFFLMIFILLIIIMIFALKLWIKRLKKIQLKEIKRIKIENELRLSREMALKSQMNPHFVFNVLNSIKAFIYKNDKQKANNYLNEFSSLIRTFLSMSNSSSITISEEIKMLRTYINLESMLLGSDFNCEIEVDSDIDQTTVKIPSLLIQPFVENAFKHGLQHKNGIKKLKLHVINLNSHIKITIEDNGVGRAESAKIYAESNKHHISYAGDAIKRRVELINRDKEIVVFNVSDLFENEISVGTLVTIIIKINEPF